LSLAVTGWVGIRESSDRRLWRAEYRAYCPGSQGRRGLIDRCRRPKSRGEGSIVRKLTAAVAGMIFTTATLATALPAGAAATKTLALWNMNEAAKSTVLQDSSGHGINGTIGAGKTSTAAAVHDVLAEEGARSAFIDADYLCQATPLPEDDAFGQALLFDNLAAVSPVYRARGYGCIVLARVVEDARDRDRYAAAFSGPGGRAHVSIVRVTASQDARVSRISAREPEGYWRELCLARTIELDEVLEDLDLDDGVVSSEGATRIDVAKAALDAAGW